MGTTARLFSHAAGDLMAVRVFRNLGLKLLAVALGATVWYLVAGEQIVERALRIPLEFVNLPAQLELVGDAPAVVDVRVRGSSGALSRVTNGELVAVLDLRTARSGQRLFHLSGDDVLAPFGIEVVQLRRRACPLRSNRWRASSFLSFQDSRVNRVAGTPLVSRPRIPQPSR